MVDASMLAKQLETGEVDARKAAAEQLCQLGEESRVAAAALVIACADDDASVSEWAVGALEQMGPPPPEMIGELAKLAVHSNELVAYWATTLLGRLGPDAAPAEASLTAVLESSPHVVVQQRAAWALGRIGADSAQSHAALAHATQASDARLARLAGEALARLK